MADITPDVALEMLEQATQGSWEGFPVDGIVWVGAPQMYSVGFEFGYDAVLAAAAPDLARAYLAEHARAERLDARVAELEALFEMLAYACGGNPDTDDTTPEQVCRDLPKRYAELEAAAAPVEWRDAEPAAVDDGDCEGADDGQV